MLKRVVLILYFTAAGFAASSQQCDCSNNFDSLVKQVTANYPGFHDKVTAARQASFYKFTDSLRKLATRAENGTCYQLMGEWINFFNDQHLSVVINQDAGSAPFIRSLFSDEEHITINADSLLRYYAQPAPAQNPIEGIWEMEDGNYKVAIIRLPDSNTYAGVVMKSDSVFWLPGQIKFKISPTHNNKYHVVFKKRSHENEVSDIILRPETGILEMSDSRWIKILPATAGQPPVNNSALPPFYFKQLDNQTNVLRISSFALDYKELIDSLISNNLDLITKTPYLILDLRDNLGGFNMSFEKILPILYTNPVVSSGTSILATPENIALYEGMLSDKNILPDGKEKIMTLIQQLKEKKNNYLVEKDEIYKQAHIYKYPEKIAVIMNEKCASATEQLILKAKQSKKCIMMGHRSAGIIDYTNIVGPRELPCSYFQLYCPTAKSNRLPEHPIDNIGIAPDFAILDNGTDWITIAAKHLHNNH
ncbi:peptidase S41-like protein [Chitinophaga niastensis]|uniref:Peptidase S41-like protein n=1 Tax=Chitinophaga niastensis TaxID=536980 RepID=A0A2P8HEL5_CHINA|nr:S41 family peptidase [Chitinophaga niastensis]PSL44662.1 peptidase S41-like protein [Chitinophaga niastensis]